MLTTCPLCCAEVSRLPVFDTRRQRPILWVLTCMNERGCAWPGKTD